MDAKQFLSEFGHIANAPGGVVKLRELVLLLAISGRLTERVADDTSALELIEDNQNCQKTLVEQKVFKRQPVQRSVTTSDQPWILPEGWAWTRLGSVTNYGDSPKVKLKDTNEDTWVLELEDIEKSTSKLLTKVFARERQFKSIKNEFPTGAVLYGKLRPYLDKVLIADSPGVCTTEINPISYFANIDAGYLRWYLKSPFFIAYADGSTHGMNLPRLGTDAARDALFAFPPLKEQACIVAKVDELMALCDKLEAQQQIRRKLQNKLRQSTLQAVASATSTHELQTTWARLADNFERLFHAPEDILAFKGLVLDLAVSGKLLNIDDHPVSTGADLVMAIAKNRIEWSTVAIEQEQKEALSMLKKLRTQQVNILEDSLPKHWVWASLLEVSKVIIDCDHKTPTYSNSGIHLIRTTDIRNGEMRLDATKKVSKESYLARSRRLIPQAGDIFFTREAPMGEAALVPSGQTVCLGQRLMLIRLFGELFSNRFLIYVIQSPSFQKRLHMSAIGMTVKHINVGDVENLMLPVPPKVEQDRIVEIIDALFRMCDHYVDQLSRKLRIAMDLAACAVSSLTGIAFEQEEEPMKAPQTELIAPLRLGTAPDIKAQAPLATILARHNGEMHAKDLWQRFGGEIDAFYAQLKTEVANGWVLEPAVAEMREKPADTVRA